MAIEREKKYLLKFFPKGLSHPKTIEQGYLFYPKGKHLRVRIVDGKEGILTIKTSIKGTDDRNEFEYTIPLQDAQEMLELCPIKLTKLRYDYPDSFRKIEIDIYPDYLRNNKSLRICEIEYKDEIGELPEFCGREVSNHKQFGNLMIAKRLTKFKERKVA